MAINKGLKGVGVMYQIYRHVDLVHKDYKLGPWSIRFQVPILPTSGQGARCLYIGASVFSVVCTKVTDIWNCCTRSLKKGLISVCNMYQIYRHVTGCSRTINRGLRGVGIMYQRSRYVA